MTRNRVEGIRYTFPTENIPGVRSQFDKKGKKLEKQL